MLDLYSEPYNAFLQLLNQVHETHYYFLNISPLPSSPILFSLSPSTHEITYNTHTQRTCCLCCIFYCLACSTWQTHSSPWRSCWSVVSPWSFLWTAVIDYTVISKFPEFLKFHKFSHMFTTHSITIECKLLRGRHHFPFLEAISTYYGPSQRDSQ